jgi:lysophospholipase L1-like esterase
MSNSEYLQIGDVAGALQDSSGSSAVIPIPNTGDMMSLVSAPFGLSYLRFNRNFLSHLTTTLGTSAGFPNGTVSYQINTASTNPVSDGSGNMLKLNYNTLAFSNNGAWMVIDAPNLSLLRVNLSTGAVTPFGTSYSYSGSYGNVGSLAISDDGNLAFVSGQGRLQVYDLSTCGSVPSTITGPVTCDNKSFTSQWNTLESTTTTPSKLSFTSSDSLIMYYFRNATDHYVKYSLTSYGHSVTTQQYLAIGDSYASGEGARNYEVGTDVSDNKCHLSKESYPYRISNNLSYTTFHSVACSGADSADILTRAQHPSAPSPNPLGDWLPGLLPQITKIQQSQPNVVTVTLGGNDIDFRGKVEECVKPGTCFNSYDNRTGIVDEIDNEYTKLVSDYQTIKGAAKATTKVYAVGYPRVAASSGSCGNNVHLNSEEIDLSNQLINHLNYTIQQAALQAGIAYIDVSTAFTGHRLCETSQDGIAMNGLTYGQEALHIIGAESFHPNAYGQEKIKQSILSQTSNFSTYSVGSGVATPPSRTSTTAQALLGPYTTTDSNIIPVARHASQIPDTFYKSSGVSFTLNQADTLLKPSTSYTVEFHSTPVTVGTFTTDSSGNLTVSTSVPSTLDNAIHSIHILGTNLAGQSIDIYQSVAVGDTPNDFDGNGITDSANSCLPIGNSGNDVDQDSIDDACDDYISPSPTSLSQLYRARQGNPANGESASDVYVERKVSLASSLFGVSDYDSDSDGWSIVGITSSAQQGIHANLKMNDIGPRDHGYDQFVPTISLRTPSNGCITVEPNSLVTITSSSPTTLTTTDTNTATCRGDTDTADLDSNSIPDNEDSLYRLRVGNALLGESTSDIFMERNINAAEAAIGISDYDDNSDGWAKIAKFNSTGSFAKIGLVDPTTHSLILDGSSALTSTILANYTKAQRTGLIPVIALSDGSSCYNYEPDSLSFVANGQTRTATLQSTNILGCS